MASWISRDCFQTVPPTAVLARVQELETELAAKTEQMENLEARQVNISGDGRSEFSLGDARAVARAENTERALAEAVMQHIIISPLFITSSKS
jgi:hypothetical protein